MPTKSRARVLDKSNWAVLALTCHVELFTQVHYRESIERDEELSDLYRDVFRFHWLEECQHAVMDEIEWCREDRTLSAERARSRGRRSDRAHLRCSTTCCKAQSAADAGYFMRLCDRSFSPAEQHAIRETVLRAYRWQYIVSGVQHPHFTKLLGGMVDAAADAENSLRARADHRLLRSADALLTFRCPRRTLAACSWKRFLLVAASMRLCYRALSSRPVCRRSVSNGVASRSRARSPPPKPSTIPIDVPKRSPASRACRR